MADQETLTSKWEKCLSIIRDNIPEDAFQTWFVPIKPDSYEDNTLTIVLPSDMYRSRIEDEYLLLLSSCLKRVFDPNVKLLYKTLVVNVGNESAYITSPSTPGNGEVYNPFIDMMRPKIPSQLNRAYNFDNFIEGECNKLARSIGQKVAEVPGATAFNPLFIYGNSGLGKTHLAHAIGLKAQQMYPDKIVLYVTSSQFQNQYQSAVLKNKTTDFLNFYQMIDFLIVDDIQEFAAKSGTQTIFFNIFNQLYQTGRQLVLTSDQPPKNIQSVDQRILSRFKWGLIAQLESPDFKTKVQILKRKLEMDGLHLSEDVIEFVANNITDNVRELEGVVSGMLAESIAKNTEITLDVARTVVNRCVGTREKNISIKDIKEIVCRYYNLEVNDIQTKSRKRDVVQARQIAMFLARKYTKNSLTIIGEQIGGRDHATVLHAIKTVMDLSDTDKEIRSSLSTIEKELK